MVHDPRTQEGWERVLRKVVCQTLKCNKPVVVNEVRQEAEKEIEDISEGFFARHDIWKKKSRDIINDEFVCTCQGRHVVSLIAVVAKM